MTNEPGEIVGLLTRGLHDASLYFTGHPRVAKTAATLVERIDAAAAADGRKAPLFIGVIDRRLIFEGKFLLGSTLIAKRLIDAAERLKCGGFLFRPGAAASEYADLFQMCRASSSKVESLDEARQMLRARGIFSIELSAPYGSPNWIGSREVDVGDDAGLAGTLGASISAFQGLREAVEGVHASGGAGLGADLAQSRGTIESMLAEGGEGPEAVFRLARYPDYESYTVGHSVRVALLLLLVGKHLGADERLLVEIGTAGLVHDVGKSLVPHEILFKPGRLDDEERRQMSAHPIVGARILLETRDADPLAVAAAFGHHRRHDGKGYPARAPWELRGRVTALVQVCDVFEALTAVRPYKPPLTPRRAYEIMLADRGAFDPSAFAAFTSAIGLYPPGSNVRLASGARASVLRPGSSFARPVVQLSHAADGRPLEEVERRVVDLSAADSGPSLIIEELISDDDVDAPHEEEAHEHEHAAVAAEEAVASVDAVGCSPETCCAAVQPSQ